MKTLKPAWRNWIFDLILLPVFLISAIAFPFLFIIVFLLVARPVYYRISRQYSYNSNKIECATGLISQNTNTIRLKDLRHINLRQGVIQRMIGTGNLDFSSAGGGGIEVSFIGIKNPKKVKNEIEELQEKLLGDKE